MVGGTGMPKNLGSAFLLAEYGAHHVSSSSLLPRASPIRTGMRAVSGGQNVASSPWFLSGLLRFASFYFSSEDKLGSVLL